MVLTTPQQQRLPQLEQIRSAEEPLNLHLMVLEIQVAPILEATLTEEEPPLDLVATPIEEAQPQDLAETPIKEVQLHVREATLIEVEVLPDQAEALEEAQPQDLEVVDLVEAAQL